MFSFVCSVSLPAQNPIGGFEPIHTLVVDGHECVDLGLPSHTLWATCNVGAEVPTDYGEYYGWGELTPKEHYNWSTYQYFIEMVYDPSQPWYTNYFKCQDLGRNICGTEYDVARQEWGGRWRMPTDEEMFELLIYCDQNCKRTEIHGVGGSVVSGPNGKSVFFPAAGAKNDLTDGSTINSVNISGHFWVGVEYGVLADPDLPEDGHFRAYDFGARYANLYWADSGKCVGFSVRPVLNMDNVDGHSGMNVMSSAPEVRLTYSDRKLYLSPQGKVSHITLYSADGHEHLSQYSPDASISLTHLPSGIYLAKVTTLNGNTMTAKLVVR